MAGDPYYRMVVFLKVILPLIALGLLSTLFLMSDRIEPGSTIPFAEGEITDRISGQQITRPFFSGMTETGDLVRVRAAELTQVGESKNRAETLSARISLVGGGEVVLVSDEGLFHLDEDIADLTGNVLIDDATGYRMRTDALTSRLSILDLFAPGEVRATGPAGDLTAGSMKLSRDPDGRAIHLLFTDGVKLIYDPKRFE